MKPDRRVCQFCETLFLARASEIIKEHMIAIIVRDALSIFDHKINSETNELKLMASMPMVISHIIRE